MRMNNIVRSRNKPIRATGDGDEGGRGVRLEITVRSRLKRWPVRSEVIHRASQELADLCLPRRCGELSVCLLSGVAMARINQRFLGHTGPTDVITFDYADAGLGPEVAVCGDRGSCLDFSGEIFICPEVAAIQGAEFGVSWRKEVLRYLVHGFLHLSGYDDLEPSAREAMKRRENLLFQRLDREQGEAWT